MSKGLSVALLLVISGCRSQSPNPQPTPTPTPSNTKYDELLLSRDGKTLLQGGKPYKWIAATSCCFTEDGEPDPEWSFASDAWIDRLVNMGANSTHIRPGPFRTLPDFPAGIHAAGGVFKDTGSKADLSQFNPKFEEKLDHVLDYGGKRGVIFEVSLDDGWGYAAACYNPRNQPGYHPYVSGNNIQNEDWCTPAGKSAIAPGSVYDRYIRHIVRISGKYSNVIYEDGNEVGRIRGLVPAWSESIGSIIRDVEKQYGYKRHLFGSNEPALNNNRAAFDYYTVHNEVSLLQNQCYDQTRVCRNNEHNPNPPFIGEQVYELFCAAQSAGTYWDLWRHGMPRAEYEKAFALIKTGCESAEKPGCSTIPNEDAIQVLPKPASEYHVQVNAALRKLKPECEIGSNCPINEGMQSFLQKVARELRKAGLCSAVQTDSEGFVDEVAVGTQQKVQGYHAYACKPGCTSGTVAWAPGSVRDTWVSPSPIVVSTASSNPDQKLISKYKFRKPKGRKN